MMPAQIDLIIPVYNEGANILATLGALAREVRTPTRVLICHDTEDDDTLPAVRNNPDAYAGLDVVFVRNPRRGAHAGHVDPRRRRTPDVRGSTGLRDHFLLAHRRRIGVEAARQGI